ncbi:hypothetical protein MSG28_016008 [Choristoneura fumiferana]|uniref:Uncharacterized protein n=1 Tax=Choristoneura fumiferana TaxID=7141 RepID=A0ACC0K676_CHOFU|nr:hypothetical protein MSG28_016008 [Choristoneura fumiferana]
MDLNVVKQSAGPAECPVCHVRCRDEHALVAHKRRHRVSRFVPGPLLDVTMIAARYIKKMIESYINKCWLRQGSTECALVKMALRGVWGGVVRAAVAADHAARAHGAAPTHVCKQCGLTHHIHRGEKEYSCPHCAKKFLFKKAMEVHLITHSAPAQLYCLECDMTFKNRMSYYQHKKYNLKHIDPAKLNDKTCQVRVSSVRQEVPESSFAWRSTISAVHLKPYLTIVTSLPHLTNSPTSPYLQPYLTLLTALPQHTYILPHLTNSPTSPTYNPYLTLACSSRPVLRTHIRMIHRNVRARQEPRVRHLRESLHGTDGSLVKKRRKKEKAAGVVTNSRVHRNLEQLNVAEGQIQMVVLSWEEVTFDNCLCGCKDTERERKRGVGGGGTGRSEGGRRTWSSGMWPGTYIQMVVFELGDGHWGRKVLEWRPRGERSPRSRWMQAAANRSDWRSTGEAYVQQWTSYG